MRYIKLSQDERNTLKKLHRTTRNSVIKHRIECLLLSDSSNSMAEVARITGSKWLKIVRLFNNWENAAPDEKLSTLSIKKGRGSKKKLNQVSHIIPELLENNPKNLNAVLHILEKEYETKVCLTTLQKFIKTQLPK